MRQHEQKMAAVEWLMKKSEECKSSQFRKFAPKQVAEGIGGSYTAIGGKVAHAIVAELVLRGIPADYLPEGRRNFFFLK